LNMPLVFSSIHI